jgi:hypothetical protein
MINLESINQTMLKQIEIQSIKLLTKWLAALLGPQNYLIGSLLDCMPG